MTAAYFKTFSRALPNEFVLVVALTLYQIGTIPACKGASLLYKGWMISKSVGPVNERI